MTSELTAQPARALVLGAGWLGQPFASSLAADGVTVTTVRRSEHERVRGGVALSFDLAGIGAVDEPGDLPLALLGHDVIVAAVAPSRARGDDYADTYPVAARAAVRIAVQSRARALLWISSTGVYGYTDGREITESSPRSGRGESQTALCTAEDIILAAATDMRCVGVMRASGLYGPGRDPAPRYRNVEALNGRFDHWLNFAWREDVIGAMRHWITCALGDLAVPTIMNVSDGTPMTVAECARLVARADGRDLPAQATRQTAPAPEPTRSNQRIRTDALRAIGWTPAVPNLRAGLLQLGYHRLASRDQPYGPHTADVRAFLRDLASMSEDAMVVVCGQWERLRSQTEFARADRTLGETIVRADREAERDAAAGPLLRMMRAREAARSGADSDDNTADSGRTDTLAEQPLHPISEPALAALMALIVRDLLPREVFAVLTSPLRDIVAAD